MQGWGEGCCITNGISMVSESEGLDGILIRVVVISNTDMINTDPDKQDLSWGEMKET